MSVMTMPLIETQSVANLSCLAKTNLPWPKYQGKVRDCYQRNDELLFVSTDRVSAFDRHLGLIPFKGQILTQLSAWWFQQTQTIIPNHFLELITPNCMRVKACQPLPIEIIVRGYITGTTNTSLWTLYQKGERGFIGGHLSNNLQKNQELPFPLVTPTTKDSLHDRPIGPDEAKRLSFLKKGEWERLEKVALNLFQFASNLLKEKGLILADTKYEFGRDETGQLVLIDELHTSDSSRYWEASNYKQRFSKLQEPESFDKEILRLWYKEHCNPYQDETLPPIPNSLALQVSARYQKLYERITNQTFKGEDPACVASLASALTNL